MKFNIVPSQWFCYVTTNNWYSRKHFCAFIQKKVPFFCCISALRMVTYTTKTFNIFAFYFDNISVVKDLMITTLTFGGALWWVYPFLFCWSFTYTYCNRYIIDLWLLYDSLFLTECLLFRLDGGFLCTCENFWGINGKSATRSHNSASATKLLWCSQWLGPCLTWANLCDLNVNDLWNYQSIIELLII